MKQSIDRQRAMTLGARHYFTGVPCIHGHTSLRLTKSRQCLACARGREAKKRRDNPEISRRWNVSAAAKISYKRYQLKKQYGLALETFEDMLSAQNWKCEICESDLTGEKRHLLPNVDHDHLTGKVRGILCGQCNNGLGRFKDSPSLLRNAAIYLESA